MGLPTRRDRPTPEPATRAEPAGGPWPPLAELERLNLRLAGYLDLWRQGAALLDGVFTPPVDVEETDDAYLVDIELPGVRSEDLDIEVTGRSLVVRGERKAREQVGILRRRGRTTGRFQHEVTLPGDVVEDGAAASLDAGVVTVRVPKQNERLRPVDVH